MRIATYNLKNLFLAGEGVQKPTNEMRPLVRTINQLEADILVLQEVGSVASLNQLNEQLAEPFRHVILRPGNSNRSIHLAVLARTGPEHDASSHQVTSHVHARLRGSAGQRLQVYTSSCAAQADEPTDLVLQRDLLQVTLTTAPLPLVLFCVHMKSKTNPLWQRLAADDIRAAEARYMAASIAPQLGTRAAVLVLGDFNDTSGAGSLEPLNKLDLIDLHGQRYQQLGRNPTTYWPKRRNRVDRILLNSVAASLARPESAVIHDTKMARTASDHLPVLIEVALQLE